MSPPKAIEAGGLCLLVGGRLSLWRRTLAGGSVLRIGPPQRHHRSACRRDSPWPVCSTRWLLAKRWASAGWQAGSHFRSSLQVERGDDSAKRPTTSQGGAPRNFKALRNHKKQQWRLRKRSLRKRSPPTLAIAFAGRWQVESAVVLQQHTFDNSFGRDNVPAEQVTAIERLPPIPAW